MAAESDDLADELDGWLAAGAPTFDAYDDSEPLPPLESEGDVNRLLRRRNRILAERGRITEAATAEIRRVREWEADRTSGIDRQVVWLERGIEQYARQTLPARGIKSLALPSGTLKLVAPGAPSVVVADEGEFVAWCLLDDDRDRFLRRTVAADKAEVRRTLNVGPADKPMDAADDGTAWFAAVDADGEVVPGLWFTKPGRDRFTVTHSAQNVQVHPDKEMD